MNLTVQILTKNNETTIERCIESVKSLDCHIVAADLGSRDGTISICQKHGVEVLSTDLRDRSKIRNLLIELNPSKWHFYIEPWEVLALYHEKILEATDTSYVRIMAEKMVTKEVRLWQKEQFVNPVFERVQAKSEQEVESIIYTIGRPNYSDWLELLSDWKTSQPTASDPHYYHACVLLAEGKLDDFLRMAEHYMFLEPQGSMSVTMNRYYYAMVQVCHKRKVKPALQNLTLCLCANPLMAEFWCLTGDVYYYLIRDFSKAKAFYQNAIVMGRHRLGDSKWPIDITKYLAYPTKMIESCDKIVSQTKIYVTE